jgi:adenylate cyclase
MTEQRRLAAILVADVVGYSKLIGIDEAGTLAQLHALRTEVIEAQLAKHAGRLFKSVGDGFLVEFTSAVRAVTCAKAIQKANAIGGLPLRIGIHVGDVVVQGDDLMGDGVNIAARVESVADPGGIAISRQVHDQVRGKVDLAFVDKGEIALKNIEQPVHVFAIAGAGAAAATPILALPDKPSIAVLPFQNMSGDPEQEYFADGIVEDIITALSRFKSLFVIARNSSFTYKGKAVDIKQVGRDLGVRYVLEGSVRKAGGRVRITGQLIDSHTGTHLWADRFEGALEDVFDLQDRITANVAGRLPVAIEQAEIERAHIKPTASLGAYDSFLLGLRALHRSTRESVEASLAHFYRAIEQDPDFAEPHCWAAIAYSRRKQGQWMADVVRECNEGVRLARRAAELRPDDSLTVGGIGFALAFLVGQVPAGVELIDRAIALNPNDSLAWHASGWIRCYNGDHDLAIQHIGHAERLSPLDPQWSQFQLARCMAHYCAGRYDESAALAQSVIRRHPELTAAYSHFARSAAMAGRVEEARAAMAEALRLNPKLNLNTNAPFPLMQRVEDRQRIREGLKLAGMPE